MNRKTNEAQSIGALIHADDLRSAEEFAQRVKRPYNRKQPYKSRKPKRARFKAQFYFKDGNSTIKYSYDYINTAKGVLVDEWRGLNKLEELINKWRKDIATVTIYFNPDTHPQTADKNYNQVLKSMSLNWLTYTHNVKFVQEGNHVFSSFEKLAEKIVKPRLNA